MVGRASRVGARVALTGTVAAAVVLASVAAVVSDPVAPKAAAEGLKGFASCRALEDWYAAHSTSGGWVSPGWVAQDDGRLYAAQPDGTVAMGEASGSADRATAGSATGTNTQESDVDEPDVAKTDGHLLVQVRGGAVVVTDVTGDRPHTLSTYSLPGGDTGAELLLVGDRVVVLGPQVDRAGGTQVVVLDISDPAAPRVASRQTFSGGLLSARQYGDVVRLVTQVTPSYPHVIVPLTEDGTPAPTPPARLTARDWLPTVTDSHGTRRLVGCSDVLHASSGAVTGTVAVTGFDPASPERRSTTAVAASGGTVYSSADRIYVASSSWSGGMMRRLGGALPSVGEQRTPARLRTATSIHELDLAGLGSSYVASGQVAGTLRDRWSMDEHDGVLRLAVRTGSTFTVQDGADRAGANAVVTMARRGHDLVVRGRVDGLGSGEDIKSVRWFDDVAVVVTFRQLDPLYTVDLSDADHPRLTGELEVPGFSGYLHPIGDDRILGLGVDASSAGVARGAQASVFDLRDLARPARLARHAFADSTSLLAVDDPRTFTWLPDAQAGYAVLQPAYQDDPAAGAPAGLVLARIAVASDGRLSVTEQPVSEAGAYDATRVLPLPGGRAVLAAGSTVRLLAG